MPVFTTPIQQQVQASTSGILWYPQLKPMTQGTTFGDTFLRNSVTPTNYPALYVTTNGAGTGVGTISGNRLLNIATTTVANDNTTIFTKELTFQRTSLVAGYPWFDGRTLTSIDIVFSQPEATNKKFFIGLSNNFTGISALPTTVAHMGVYLDTSVANTFKLTSADGSTQTTTDTTVVASTGNYRLNISWSGLNAAVLTFYSDTASLTTVGTQQTVAALGSVTEFTLQFYVQTTVTVVKNLQILGWKAVIS